MSDSDIDIEALLDAHGSLWKASASSNNSAKSIHNRSDCRALGFTNTEPKEITHPGQAPLRPNLCDHCFAGGEA